MEASAERPQDVELEALRQEAIATPEGVAYFYNVGALDCGEGIEVVSIAIIACVGERFLVAIPGAAWNRKAAVRKLPVGSIEKPVSANVTGGLEENREEVDPDVSCQVWLGWLKKSLRSHVDFTGTKKSTVDFVNKDTADLVWPYAEALVGVADERFKISSGGKAPVEDERLGDLEKKFETMQASLERLLELQENKAGSGFVSPFEETAPPRGILKSKDKAQARTTTMKTSVQAPQVLPRPKLFLA